MYLYKQKPWPAGQQYLIWHGYPLAVNKPQLPRINQDCSFTSFSHDCWQTTN